MAPSRRVENSTFSSQTIPGFDGVDAGDEGGTRLRAFESDSASPDSDDAGVNVIIKPHGCARSLTLKELDAATTRKASKHILPWLFLTSVCCYLAGPYNRFRFSSTGSCFVRETTGRREKRAQATRQNNPWC